MAIVVNTLTRGASLVQRTPTVPQLAPREREVLHLLSTGRPYKQIADELKLSMGTIRTYIRRLYWKLQVNCRTEAVVKYLANPPDRETTRAQ